MARGSGLGLVARRSLSDPAPVLAVAVNVLVVCTLVSGLAASLSLLQRDALRSAMSLAPPEDTVLVVNSPYAEEDPAGQDDAIRAALAPLISVAGGDVVALAQSTTYDVQGSTGVRFASVSEADLWLDAARGSLPTAAPGTLEVAAPVGMPVAVGDVVTLASRTDEQRIKAVVTGTWLHAEGRERWTGALDPGALLIDPDRFAEVAGTGTQRTWRAVPDIEALAPADLGELAAAAGAADADVAAAGRQVSASVRSETGLVEVVSARARELAVLRALLLVPAGLLMLVAAAGLLLVASGLADVRRGEESLLRSRGAGYRQLAAPTVVETLIVCAAAAAVAPIVASAVLRIGDVRPPLDPAAWIGSAVAAVACALALSLPVVVRAVTGDRGQQLAVERQQRRALTLLATALLVVSGVGALGIVTLRGFGDTVRRTTVRSPAVDPLLVASPALVLLALAALATVLLLPPALRLVAAAAASRGVPLAIGTRFASRAPTTAVPVALATALAVGTVAFASVEAASSAAARESRAAYVAGPDVRVTAPAPVFRRPVAAEERDLRDLPGVTGVEGVHRSTLFLDGLPADVLVTDVTPTSSLFGPEADNLDVAPLTDASSDGPVPVVLTEQLAGAASLRVGDTLTLALLGVPTDVLVAETVPYVRTVGDGRGAVLADARVLLPRLARQGPADPPTEWWLETTDGAAERVADQLAERPDLAAGVLTRDRVLHRLDDDPGTGGATLGRVLLLTGGGCLVVGVLLLFSAVLLRRRERAAEAWRLGAVGAGRRDLLGVLGWEYAVVTGAGVVIGVLAGTVVAAVTLVSMTLGPDGQLLVPAPALALPWPLLIGAPLTMAVVPLAGLLWLARRDHARSLEADRRGHR